MDCLRTQQMFAAAAEGYASDTEQRAFDNHLQRCRPCRQAYADYRTLLRTLRNLEAPRVPAGLRQAVHAQLAARRPTRSRFAVSAAVFLGLLGLVGGGLLFPQDKSTQGRPETGEASLGRASQPITAPARLAPVDVSPDDRFLQNP